MTDSCAQSVSAKCMGSRSQSQSGTFGIMIRVIYELLQAEMAVLLHDDCDELVRVDDVSVGLFPLPPLLCCQCELVLVSSTLSLYEYFVPGQ
jgi:hypothetical protein